MARNALSQPAPRPSVPDEALDDRVAIVGTAGSGKTYAAKGLVERLLRLGARVAIIDPLGVWWGLRAAADGTTAGFPVVVFGGRHADVELTETMGPALARLIAAQALACVIDLSELGSGAARRRFMAAFSEAIYDANTEPLHLVLDEADLWAPQRPLPDQTGLLGHIDEIVRRGRVRGFIPWLITQRPAVVHKDVLSQADILIAMKLTSSQDRDAIGGWIEGQADRAEGKRILADLPRLPRGEAYLWAPGHALLERVAFPKIATFDSSRTPKRGERPDAPKALAEVDLSAIIAALQQEAAPPAAQAGPATAERVKALEQDLAAARTRIGELETERAALIDRLARISALAGGGPTSGEKTDRVTAVIAESVSAPALPSRPRQPRRSAASVMPDASLHPAARKLLAALAQHAPARFTWGQAATLAGLKSSGGHFNTGRKTLREAGHIVERDDLVTVSDIGMAAAGEVPPAPKTAADRLALWCERLPSPGPEMLRALAARGEAFVDLDALALEIGKQPKGGHWNTGLALLRNNALVETDGRNLRAAAQFRR